MVLFGTQQWLDAFCQAVNQDTDYAKAAKDYEGSMTCISEPEAGVCTEKFVMFFDPYHGSIRQWEMLGDERDKDAAFVLSAPYSVWKQITKGEQDMLRAVMGRKLKVKGKMTHLIRQVGPAKALTDVMVKLPTQYHDEQ